MAGALVPTSPTDEVLALVHDSRLEIESLVDRLDRIVAGQNHPVGSKVQEGWVGCPVVLTEGLAFEVTVSRDAPDPLSEQYRNGRGHLVDSELVGIMLQTVRPGDRVLDLGGFLGTFGLAASAAGCEVCAVEANRANAALMRMSAVRNGFSRMRVLNVAATDAARTLEFVENGPWGLVVEEAQGRPTVRVQGLPVDALLAELGWERVDFLKIDIEGSEVEALEGMRNLLKRDDGPPLIVESNGHTLGLRSSSPEALRTKLVSFGYTPYSIGQNQLREIEPGQLQPRTIANWLAVKKAPPAIEGFSIAEPMDREELILVLIETGSLPFEPHRAYVAGALAGAGPEIRSDRRIVDLLSTLRSDASQQVRLAATWSISE